MDRLRIRTLLIIGAAVIAAVPALIVAVGAGLYMRDHLVDAALQRAPARAGELAMVYEGYLDKHAKAIEMLADSLSPQDLSDGTTVRTMLDTTRANYPSFMSSITLVDLKGAAIAISTTAAEQANLNLGDRNWFRTAVSTRKPVIDSEVIRGRVSGRLLLVLAAPVLGANGEVKGVLSGGLDLEDLERLIGERAGNGQERAALASNAGALLVHPRKELVTAGRSIDTLPLWKEMQAAPSGVLVEFDEIDGSDLIGGYATVPSAGWKVWVSEPRSAIDKVLYDSYARAGLIGAVGAGGGLVLAFFGAAALARPIERLRSTATAVADGDLTTLASEEGPRETSDLARAINAMSVSLRERISSEQETQAELRQTVSDYSEVARRIVDGDLTARAPVSDHPELGPLANSLNMMTESMARVVNEIREATAELLSSSSEILVATSQQVSATAEEAVAVKQTASSVAEVKQTGSLAMQKARAVAQAAQRASEVVETGRATVEATIAGSRDAKQRMETVAQRILGFIEQAEAIAEINASVSELAEQSNLLAVNASIEAAKAGEFGRGFAVVAGEIKTLSDQSKQATAQVRRILVDIQKVSQAAMLAAEQGVKAAEAGAGRAAQSGDAIQNLSESISEAAKAGQQIAAASQEQNAGMDQIAAAMRNIEQSTNQTVAATRQVERSARDLNDLAGRLSRLVAFASHSSPAKDAGS